MPWNVGLAICVSQPDHDIKYTFIIFVPHITIRLIAFIESMCLLKYQFAIFLLQL